MNLNPYFETSKLSLFFQLLFCNILTIGVLSLIIFVFSSYPAVPARMFDFCFWVSNRVELLMKLRYVWLDGFFYFLPTVLGLWLSIRMFAPFFRIRFYALWSGFWSGIFRRFCLLLTFFFLLYFPFTLDLVQVPFHIVEMSDLDKSELLIRYVRGPVFYVLQCCFVGRYNALLFPAPAVSFVQFRDRLRGWFEG